jgi:hypothetical protein
MKRERRLTDPELAYMHDPEFNALVKTIEGMLYAADFTPSELRKAAVLACIHFEMRKPSPLFFLREAEEKLRR